MINYSSDTISAVQAKFEAQKICFSPLSFQAVRAMRELGVLKAVSEAGTQGMNREEIAAQAGVSVYGAGVLAEIALGMGVLKLNNEERFILGKIGWFILEDAMTAVNFNFINDVCYQGAFELGESVKTGKPQGLSVFGKHWKTIYEALSSLPEKAKKSWFEFDHFYSDIAFPDALPLVFATPTLAGGGRLFDIGGNTAKWAIACCNYSDAVKVTIIDLPGQTEVARRNTQAAGFENRIDVFPCDVLDTQTAFPAGADAVWMSQFLDCFSLEQITAILRKVNAAVEKDADIWVLEPLWDMQNFEASAFSLQAVSLYFTCMANGNSKMYRFAELCAAVERAGFELKASHHNLGSNSYSLLRFRKAQ
jgi:hypothetical protein